MVIAALISLIVQTTPFPTSDGFIYPGQPGSDGIVNYDRRWAEFSATMKPAGESRLHDADWMLGRWTITMRDYEYEPPKPGQIVTQLVGTASISLTSDGRWFEIVTEAVRYSGHRYLGYDSRRSQWVLESVMAPGVSYDGPMMGSAWSAGRLQLGPAELDYHGLKSTDRITFVRDSNNRFRIVTETHVNGGYVAVDDLVFDRVP